MDLQDQVVHGLAIAVCSYALLSPPTPSRRRCHELVRIYFLLFHIHDLQ